MAFNIIAPLSEMTGLPPIVFICALAIILILIVFGILILIKVRNIVRVLSRVNNSLDIIAQRLGRQPEEAKKKTAHDERLGSAANQDRKSADSTESGHNPRKVMSISSSRKNQKKSLADLETAGRRRQEPDTGRKVSQVKSPEEHAIRREISAKIYELLKKSGKPTPYHDLTEKLSKDYPGYDYDYFIREIEGLKKEGKVLVQLVAGKLYFQVKQP